MLHRSCLLLIPPRSECMLLGMLNKKDHLVTAATASRHLIAQQPLLSWCSDSSADVKYG